MATVDAAKRQYRDEYIAVFEDGRSVLQATTVQENQRSGNEAIFLVSGSGGASAVTRGVEGLIAARADDNTQNTCTLVEWHDLVRKTRFNIFASQGNQRRLMQATNQKVINRKIDDLIIAELDTLTNDTGTAAVASLDLVIYARTILGNNFVDLSDEDNLFAVVSPAFEGYMMQIPEFASADYVATKPFVGPARRFRRWGGFNWICHPRLTNSVGAGGNGASEQCFFYHRDCIGSAADVDGTSIGVGYDEEQDYSFSRASIFMGAKLLQNSGGVMVKHNAAGYVAQ